MAVELQFCQIIAEVLGKGLTAEDIPRGPGLLQELHIDSLIALQIIVQVEQEFDVAIDDDDLALEMLDSVDGAAAYLEQAIGRHGAQPGAS